MEEFWKGGFENTNMSESTYLVQVVSDEGKSLEKVIYKNHQISPSKTATQIPLSRNRYRNAGEISSLL